MAGEFAMKKKGIDPHKDMELIQNVEFANIATAFASGTGDYVQLFEPQATIFEREGKGRVLASFGVESGRLPYTVFMAKKSYIDNNGETVQKFTNALYKAQQWVQEQDTAKIADAVKQFFPDTDIEIIKGVIERYKSQGSYATDGIVDDEEWNNLQDVMEEAGELKERVEHSVLVDNSFAEKAKQ